MNTTQSINDGIRVYSSPFLKIYDALVMGLIVKYVWRCHAENLVYFYDENISSNHADIGVGTGYCLDKCNYSNMQGSPRLALIDLRQSCLNHTSKRLSRFNPETYVRDVCSIIRIRNPRFDSIGLGGILHCLPGDMQQKCKVLDNIEPIAKNNTVIFGYTLVNAGVKNTWISYIAGKILRLLKVINNHLDSPQSLQVELARRFEKYEITTIGNMSFFKAQHRKQA